MDPQIPLILLYLLLATGAGLVGGLLASFWSPRPTARSAVQHFAAGAVLAAVASSVIPEVERIGTVEGILSGLAAGGLAMIGLKWLVLRIEREQRSRNAYPIGLASAAAIDTLLDGAMIRASFFAGQRAGALLAIALAIELFFLTLSVGAEFRKGKSARSQQLAITSGIAGMLLVGALGAGALLGNADPPAIAVVLAFGAAALIYLIAEELLVETIQAEESLFSTAMLFGGFLLLLTLKLPSNQAS